MKKENINLFPIIGSVLLLLLYAVSLNTRGFFTPAEYDFALLLKSHFPAVSGTVIPKLPAMFATLLTGLLLWLTAAKLKLRNPGTAAGCYLCFPPVWWFGTSALPAAVLVLFITIAAFALFISRKEKNFFAKAGCVAAGAVGALGAAFAAKSGLFDWAGIAMAFMPMIFLLIAIRLEKLDDRSAANSKLDRIAISSAVMCGILLLLFLLPSFAKMLDVTLPPALALFAVGEKIWAPAVSLLVPLPWIYILFKAKNYSEKLFFLCIASGFVMLTLPPSLPWQRLSYTLQSAQIISAAKQCDLGNTICFADDSTAGAFSYVLNIPVRRAGRLKGDLPPTALPSAVNEALADKNVSVISFNGELDPFLPSDRNCIRLTLHKCKIFYFSKE